MSDGLRQIVLATDLSEECLRALEWSLQQVSGDRVKGDKYHIVHVAKLKDETPEIHHGPVGTSFQYHESSQAQTQGELDKVKGYLQDRVNSVLDREGVAHETHLFLEGESAPASAVAEIIAKVAKQVSAGLIVAARSNKTSREKWFLGTVAESLARLPHPLLLVSSQPP